MWILQGLMVCCVIMGMSKMAQAENFQTKLKEYKQDLNEEMRIWKIDNSERKKEIRIWKKKQIKELVSEKNQSLKKIEDDFTQRVEELGRSARTKSKKFQLKSDLALVKSIKLKRQKFNLRKKALKIYYKKLQKIELAYNKKYKEYKLESFREKQELLNDNKPDFFPNFARYKNIRSVKKQKKIKK